MNRSSLLIAAIVTALTAGLTFAAIPLLRNTLYYPYVVLDVGDVLRMYILNYGHAKKGTCEEKLSKLLGAIGEAGDSRRIVEKRCLEELDPHHLRLFSREPLDAPSARWSDGVMSYVSDKADIALLACTESERQTAQAPASKRLHCYPPGVERPGRSF